jgi:hypothetical protein
MICLKRLMIFILLCTPALTDAAKAQSADLLNDKQAKKPSRYPELEGVVLTYQMDFLRGFPGAPYQYRQLRSGGFSFAFYVNERLGTSRFSYAAGIGLSSRNYFTNLKNWKSGDIWPDSPAVKNKFVFTTYEVIPVEIRFTARNGSNQLKAFKASAGLNVGYTGSLGTKSVLGSFTQKFKGREDLLDLNPWRIGLQGRLGYHRLGISVYYGLNNWFQTNVINGSPASLGLSLLL